MTKKDRERLKEKSQKVFGASSRWQTIMNKGRPVTDKNNNFLYTELISVEEIEAKMDEALKSKESKWVNQIQHRKTKN